ncbi:hypothetical protein FQN54_004024 [Arachnomyces sp. PD_36]|nr:hypothetical protein FQN54_004024 [Arachnomyces sp. PD_36]
MASFKTDAELMTNYVSASPVPAGTHFVTVLDENSRPIVVSLSSDKVPKLQIIRHDPKGVQYLFDLGACFDLPTEAIIQAFDVVQAPNKTLYLVFAYVRDAKSSHVVLSKPFAPTVLQEGVKLRSIPGDWTIETVEKIMMSPMPTPSQSSAAYPLVLLAHANLDQSTSWGKDITLATPDKYLTGWSTNNSLSAPVNVTGIIDISPAVNFHGQGIFVLYKTTTGESKLYGEFIEPDDQSTSGNVFQFATDIQCPKGATSISTILDQRSASALMIGSPDGISYLDSSQAVLRTSVPVPICKDDKIHGCKTLEVAQDSEFLSIWFTSSTGQLGYIRTTRSDVTGLKLPKPILLLPAGKTTSFSPSISGASTEDGQIVWQTIVSNDKYGNLTLLEQVSDLGLWRKKPFYCNDDATASPVQSYSMTIKAFESNGSPTPNASIQLKAASAVSGILNGSTVTLKPGGDWYTMDPQGTLNFIVPTESIASQSLTITGIKDSKGDVLSSEIVVFDPTKRSMDKLGSQLDSFRSYSELKNAKTQKGTPLFDSDNMPHDEALEQGLNCLKTLHGACATLPSDGSSTSKSAATAQVPSLGSRSLDTSHSSQSDVGDFFMDAWHWISEMAHEAVDWLVDTAGKVWKFVCKIAGEAFEFVLDCAEKVGEALTWVWNKIKVGFEKLIEFIGYLFNWDDILQTKNQVSTLIDAGCDLAAAKAREDASAVDKFFDDLLAKIDGIEIKKDANVSPNSGSDKSQAPAVYDAQHSTSFNWTSERMKNGGLGSSKAVAQNNEPHCDVQKRWDEIFSPALASIQKSFIKVGEDIRDLWLKQGSISASDFMKLCKDVLKAAVTTIHKLVVALIEAFQKVIQIFKEYGNKSISIPIFSSLYKLITGHELTAFDAMSLLIAIPTTILTKMITGAAPPKIPNLNSDLLDGLLLGGTSVEITEQTKLDFNTLTTGLTVSGTLISTIVNTIKFFYGLASDGTGGARESLTGSAFLEFFSVVIDMFSTMNSLPTDPSLPGLEYRKWISYISLFRGGSHVIAAFVPEGAAGTAEAKDKTLLVLDLATTLINFGLYQEVGIAEAEAASTWKDFDVKSNVIGIEGSLLNAISGIGYFTAFMFKEEIEVSGFGLAILEGATVGLAALEGIKWKIDYDRGKHCLLTPSAT